MANKTDKTDQMLENVLEQEQNAQGTTEDYSLNDDRRVKTLSPTALVARTIHFLAFSM